MRLRHGTPISFLSGTGRPCLVRHPHVGHPSLEPGARRTCLPPAAIVELSTRTRCPWLHRTARVPGCAKNTHRRQTLIAVAGASAVHHIYQAELMPRTHRRPVTVANAARLARLPIAAPNKCSRENVRRSHCPEATLSGRRHGGAVMTARSGLRSRCSRAVHSTSWMYSPTDVESGSKAGSLNRVPRGAFAAAGEASHNLYRCRIEVNRLSAGASAMPARTGFRSTYAMQASRASSSARNLQSKRPSRNRPVQPSSRFAARAIDSFR